MLKSLIAFPVSRRNRLWSLFLSRLSSAIILPFVLSGWRRILHPFTRTKNLAWLLVWFPLQAQSGVVLLYHHVDTDTPAITSIPPGQFDKHLSIIEAEGFDVLPLDQLVENSQDGSITRKEVAITFDDAFISIYTEAYPRLKKRGWPFTIFVAPAYVGASNLYLTWEQLAKMATSGATIENHTMTHTHMVRVLTDESPAAWRQRMLMEIQDASTLLSQHGYVSTHFAYPYGEYNLELLDLVGELGLTGFGQQSGAIGPYSDPRLLPRFPLAGIYTGERAFREKLRSLALPAEAEIVDPLVIRTHRPPLKLTFMDDAIHLNRLTCYGPGGLMNIAREQNTVTVSPTDDITVGRTRYNCTLPQGNRYYWFSQLWLRKRDDGTWYPEP